jgi:hypothetical protein
MYVKGRLSLSAGYRIFSFRLSLNCSGLWYCLFCSFVICASKCKKPHHQKDDRASLFVVCCVSARRKISHPFSNTGGEVWHIRNIRAAEQSAHNRFYLFNCRWTVRPYRLMGCVCWKCVSGAFRGFTGGLLLGGWNLLGSKIILYLGS